MSNMDTSQPQCDSQVINLPKEGSHCRLDMLPLAHLFGRLSTRSRHSLARHPRLLSGFTTQQRFSSISTQLKEPRLPKLPPPFAEPVLAIPQGTASSHIADQRSRLEPEIPMLDLLACNLNHGSSGQDMSFPLLLRVGFWHARGILKGTSESPQRKVSITSEPSLVVIQQRCYQCVHCNETVNGCLTLCGIIYVEGAD